MQDEFVRSRSSWYLDNVVIPDSHELHQNPADYRRAFHALTSAFQLRDWVFREFRGTPVIWGANDLGDFQKELEARCPQFQILRDGANACKHLEVDRFKVLNDASQITARSFEWEEADWNRTPLDGSQCIVLHDANAGPIAASFVVSDVRDFWIIMRATTDWDKAAACPVAT